nr:putative late blight resistance protein homolog R1A-10 isoform X2 [Ipomoea batatas]
MACVGLISLIRTLELQFLEPRPFLVVDYNDEIQCLRQRLSVLVALLEESEKELNVSQAEREIIARVKDISLRAEDEIESEVMEILSNGASHETLHQILQRLAQDTEGLIQQRNTTQMSEKVELGDTEPLFEYANRWLTFQTVSIRPKFSDNYNFHKSRTLLFFFGAFGGYSGMPVSWRQNVSLKMIRVLDLRTISFDEAPTFDISDLILLRYLALSTIKYVRVLKHHPSLQTLIVKFQNSCRIGESESDEEIGSKWLQGLWKSQNLRFIEYSYPLLIYNDEIPVQDILHTLYWVPYLQCTKEFVLKIPNVKVLGIRCSEVRAFQTETWWDNLHYFTKLEKLIVEDIDSVPIKLRSINSFPQSLKKLKLVGTQLRWELITVISMLPNLESLKLLQAYKMGEEWETGDGGFPKLKFLFISGAKLKNWETISDHFPILQRLALHQCLDLEKIPEGFADITTLQLIELKNCYPSLVESAKDIQEEQSSYGNDQLVVRDYDTRSW